MTYRVDCLTLIWYSL